MTGLQRRIYGLVSAALDTPAKLKDKGDQSLAIESKQAAETVADPTVEVDCLVCDDNQADHILTCCGSPLCFECLTMSWVTNNSCVKAQVPAGEVSIATCTNAQMHKHSTAFMLTCMLKMHKCTSIPNISTLLCSHRSVPCFDFVSQTFPCPRKLSKSLLAPQRWLSCPSCSKDVPADLSKKLFRERCVVCAGALHEPPLALGTSTSTSTTLSTTTTAAAGGGSKASASVSASASASGGVNDGDDVTSPETPGGSIEIGCGFEHRAHAQCLRAHTGDCVVARMYPIPCPASKVSREMDILALSMSLHRYLGTILVVVFALLDQITYQMLICANCGQ